MRSFKDTSLHYANGFHDGYLAALKDYAWWKDGIEQVGSCSTTLKQARVTFEDAFQKQMEIDLFIKKGAS